MRTGWALACFVVWEGNGEGRGRLEAENFVRLVKDTGARVPGIRLFFKDDIIAK